MNLNRVLKNDRRNAGRAGLLLALTLALTPGRASATLYPWVFTYQGQLMQSGVPMNGSANFVFKLFDSAIGGSQTGATIAANAVPLTDGRFTVDLDFTNGGALTGVYDGNERWLDITVNGTLLTPREKVNAAPHSLLARQLALPSQHVTTSALGLQIISNSDVGQERVIHSVTNSGHIGAIAIYGEALGPNDNENVGVSGHSTSANGFGVAGSNTSPVGNCTGVYGVSESNQGFGVFGHNASPTGATRGVYGKVVSSDGYAGYFEGRGYFSQALGVRTVGAPQAMFEVQGSLPATGLAMNVNDQLYVNQTFNFTGIGRNTRITSSEFFGVQAPVAGGLYGGMYVNTSASTAKPFYGYATAGNDRAWTYFDGATSLWHLSVNLANRLTVTSTGLVGVGRTPAANNLEVEGTASKTVAGNWLANSDARIKRDVAPLEHPLETLDRVRLVSFRYTDDYRSSHPSISDRRYLNVIAQEFRQVFPDHVQESGESLPSGEKILQVDTYPLVIYSAAAIQELHRQLEEREARLTSQEERLAAQDRQLAAQEQRLSALLTRVESLESHATMAAAANLVTQP